MKRTAKTGDTMKYKLDATFEFGGQDIGFTASVTEKVVDVASDGKYKIESTQADAKVNMNGQEQEMPDQAGSTTVTYAPNGDVVDIKGDQADSTGAFRMANLETLHSPDAPVKAGDSWSNKVEKDAKTGAVAATQDYKFIGMDKFGDKPAVKVSISVKETEGSDPASNEGTLLLDPTDFSMFKSDTTWTNAPIPGAPGPISGKVTMTRV